MTKPLFLTKKFQICPLRYRVYDFCIRIHSIAAENIYQRQCTCTRHMHNGNPCSLVNAEIFCRKCKTPNLFALPYQALLHHAKVFALPEQALAHNDKVLQTNRLFKCCVHTHYPPCGSCISCKTTDGECILKEPFECEFTTDAVCLNKKPHSSQLLPFDNILDGHLRETQVSLFYFCQKHAHYHKSFDVPVKLRQHLCYLQTAKCCNEAVFVKNLKESFSIIHTTTGGEQLKIFKEYIIYDPSLWHDQSLSYFTSFIKAILWSQHLIGDRYKYFEQSKFKVSNIKKYKSGKHSIVRTNITGFETNGIYQTATISCNLPQDMVMLPQCLVKIMEKDYDLSLVCIKRDPCIKPTCMFVLKTIINPDPDVQVIVINDAIAKPLNQDQDGDKNAVYALPKYTSPGYDKHKSFVHKVAKIEMALAYSKRNTLIAIPRYSISENSRQLIYRHSKLLLQQSEFYQRTHSHGLKHMIEAGCGYLCKEYDQFCALIRQLNNDIPIKLLSFDDVLGITTRLADIIVSGTKGHIESLEMFKNSLTNKSSRTLGEQLEPSRKQMSRYITSGQQLRSTGRERFILLYSESELKSSFGTIYLNTKPFVNVKPFYAAFVLMFNEASIEECLKDLDTLL